VRGLHLIAQSWFLLKRTPFGLKEALDQEWCEYKTERNLRKFLERNEYPFHFFELGQVPVYVTKEAYQKAQEAERKHIRIKNLESKRASQRKKIEKLRKETPGIKPRTPGTKGRTLGTKGRTSGTLDGARKGTPSKSIGRGW